MPYDYSRTDRIGEQIKRELSMLIRNELKDPRISMVSILDVEITKDLSKAKVFFDALNQDEHEACEKGLNNAAGFTPALTFVYDDTEQRANDLSVMIDKAISSDKK